MSNMTHLMRKHTLENSPDDETLALVSPCAKNGRMLLYDSSIYQTTRLTNDCRGFATDSAESCNDYSGGACIPLPNSVFTADSLSNSIVTPILNKMTKLSQTSYL